MSAQAPPRYRGPNQRPPWHRNQGDPIAVIRLPLDVSDPNLRRRVEQLYQAAFSVRRTLQRQAARRCRAYWAACHEREVKGPGAVRERLGLSRAGLERAGYAHVDRSRHLAHHLTKALVMHTADQVWEGASRHLFPDASGHRAGAPRPGRWWDFQTIPGRARSHTTERKWETFRLAGTLQGHLDRYRAPSILLDATVADALGCPAGESVLRQPRRLRPPVPPASGSWWDHRGALVVVFAGGPASQAGDVLLPVRLPQGAGSWAHTAHHLGDESLWHKLDLVRFRDPGVPGGWRYEAHLLVLKAPYCSPATLKRRTEAAGLDRLAGIDVNVSKVAVVSVDRHLSEVRASNIGIDPPERARLAAERLRTRRRARALERSRRCSNTAQYQLSQAQQRRAARRAEAGQPAVAVNLPRGPRMATAAGRPHQAYRRDLLSQAYRRLRGEVAAAGAARTRARDDRARRVAAEVVGTHGASLVVEEGDLRLWARRWGRGMVAFTPGRLLAAIGAEAQAVAALSSGPGLVRAATRPTALSQHCLCATKVPKTLADRTHRCPSCGLVGDRDLVAAALGAFVTFFDPLDPGTARVDYQAARLALAQIPGLQAALAESSAAPPERLRRRRDGRAQASARRRRAARQSAGSAPPTTPDELPTAPANGDHAGALVVSAGPDQWLAQGQDLWPGA